jgi:hypothetical protein
VCDEVASPDGACTAAIGSHTQRPVGHWVGESVLVLSSGVGLLGAIYPDQRWSRAFARGFYWDWVIPRWEVRTRCLAWAALMAALAFFFR